ncbi:MAG: single-stranded DNA-binding protein [Planctomycetota bacterium]
MASLNKVMLIGNLTRDPEMRYTQSNMAICKLGLAVNDSWKSKDGQTQERTLFIDCTAFGKTGEIINQYMSKGRPIFIEGSLRLDQWEDKQSGQKRSKHEVIIDNFQFLGGRDDNQGGGGGGGGGGYGRGNQGGNQGGNGGGYASRQQPARQQQPPQDDAPAPFNDDDQQFNEDDIPF